MNFTTVTHRLAGSLKAYTYRVSYFIASGRSWPEHTNSRCIHMIVHATRILNERNEKEENTIMFNTQLRQTMPDTDTRVPLNVRCLHGNGYGHIGSVRAWLWRRNIVCAVVESFPIHLCPIFQSLIEYSILCYIFGEKKNLQEDCLNFCILYPSKTFSEPAKSVVCLVRVCCSYGSANIHCEH